MTRATPGAQSEFSRRDSSANRSDAVKASSDWRVSLATHAGATWHDLRTALTAAGIRLPVEAHEGFPVGGRAHRVLVAVSDADGRYQWGGVADVGRSRAVPWRSIVRVHRVRAETDATVLACIDVALARIAARERALRVHVDLSDGDTQRRHVLAEWLSGCGFTKSAAPRQYERTIFINLERTEQELLASFHPTCRRHIRAFSKAPLQCELLTDTQLASELHALDVETMTRTGGSLNSIDWRNMLAFVADHPDQAVLLGVKRTDTDGERALVGYVLGVRHGDTVEYRRAASTRLADLRAPLLYMPTWELMCWGMRRGARWFDFGGIGDGSYHTGVATGGISDFKRYFSSEVTEVGFEMVRAPSRLMEALARAVSGGGALVHRLRGARERAASRAGTAV